MTQACYWSGKPEMSHFSGAFKNTASPALGHTNGTGSPPCVSSILMIGRAPFATDAERTINTVFDQPRRARCTSPHKNSRPDIGAENGTGTENGTGPNLWERKTGRVKIYAHACPFSFHAAMFPQPSSLLDLSRFLDCPVFWTWLTWVNQAQTPPEMAALRHCLRHGRPFGCEPWTARMESALNLPAVRPHRRPKKRPL